MPDALAAAGTSLRLVAALAQCEIALVRRDAVAGPLLAQAARAAEGLPVGPRVRAAAGLMRDGEPSDALRKVAQALCRAALQDAQADVLRIARGAG